MNKGSKSIDNFFIYLGLGFVISSLKTDFINQTGIEIVSDIFSFTMYNFVNGIFYGLGVMVGIDIFYILKKNLKNEIRCNNLFWVNICSRSY